MKKQKFKCQSSMLQQNKSKNPKIINVLSPQNSTDAASSPQQQMEWWVYLR
jgi:hypothetical protein